MGIWKLSSIKESGNTLLSYVRGEVRLIYVLVFKALHMVFSPKNCWSLTGMFPCNSCRVCLWLVLLVQHGKML